jgi:hypothetical protein
MKGGILFYQYNQIFIKFPYIHSSKMIIPKIKVMSFYFFPTKYEQLKMEYLNKKMEQMKEIDELEKRFQYYAQFFEPSVELRVCPENYLMAQTQIKHQNNPQPDFIQVCVGILLEDKSNYDDLKVKANELINKELLENYPQIFK